MEFLELPLLGVVLSASFSAATDKKLAHLSVNLKSSVESKSK